MNKLDQERMAQATVAELRQVNKQLAQLCNTHLAKLRSTTLIAAGTIVVVALAIYSPVEFFLIGILLLLILIK